MLLRSPTRVGFSLSLDSFAGASWASFAELDDIAARQREQCGLLRAADTGGPWTVADLLRVRHRPRRRTDDHQPGRAVSSLGPIH